MIGVFVGFSRIFLLGILIFKGFTARRVYKSFSIKGLSRNKMFFPFTFAKGAKVGSVTYKTTSCNDILLFDKLQRRIHKILTVFIYKYFF
jgi:hypothetical protein